MTVLRFKSSCCRFLPLLMVMFLFTSPLFPGDTGQTSPTFALKHRQAQDVLNKTLPQFRFDGWARQVSLKPEAVKLTLYRWWTDTCPYCRASLPGFEKLRKKYEPRGLLIVAVYHPKPPRTVITDDILKDAAKKGYNGAIAVDRDWSEMWKAYLSKDEIQATSFSVLIDTQRKIRFFHPGPEIHPSNEPSHLQCQMEFNQLENTLELLLKK